MLVLVHPAREVDQSNLAIVAKIPLRKDAWTPTMEEAVGVVAGFAMISCLAVNTPVLEVATKDFVVVVKYRWKANATVGR